MYWEQAYKNSIYSVLEADNKIKHFKNKICKHGTAIKGGLNRIPKLAETWSTMVNTSSSVKKYTRKHF